MRHVIINTIGSAGDINPFIVIGKRLLESGHRVDFIASAYFEEKVKRHGLNFLSLGTVDDYHRAINNPEIWKLEKGFAMVWSHVMGILPDCYALIEQNYTPDNTLLIGSSIAIACRVAQEKLNLPMASVHLSPSLMLSTYDTPQSPTSPLPEWFPRPLRSLWLSTFDNLFLDRIAAPPLNKFRASLNLPPVSHILRQWIHSPQLVIGAFPDWFASVQPDWPANTFTSNFLLYKSTYDEPLSEHVTEFLQAGTPPIVITAGTAMAFGKQFLSAGLEAAQRCSRRSILVCAFADQLPDSLPETALHVPYANFHDLLQQAAAVVHHGGIGTSAMALATGCPQVIVPFAHDQYDNAMRLEKMNAGKAVLRRNDVNEWRMALEAVLPLSDKCRAFKDQFHTPAEVIIEKLLADHRML